MLSSINGHKNLTQQLMAIRASYWQFSCMKLQKCNYMQIKLFWLTRFRLLKINCTERERGLCNIQEERFIQWEKVKNCCFCLHMVNMLVSSLHCFSLWGCFISKLPRLSFSYKHGSSFTILIHVRDHITLGIHHNMNPIINCNHNPS